MKLYELTNDYQQLLEVIGDVDSDVYKDTLESIQGAIEDKCENTAKVIKTIDAEAKAIKEEEKRLSTRRTSLEDRIKGMKEYLQQNLEAVGLDKVKGQFLTVSLQNNPPSLYAPDESVLPEECFVPQEPRLDRKALLNILKTGEEIAGAEIRQGRSLRIR